jgi:glyoxylase-like metal-dependent hydrolase (beta-lactamase superfamily II)
LALVRLEADLFCVRMPIPFPLGSVNAYLVRTRRGAVLVDAGLRTPECLAALQEALDAAGLQPSDFRAVILTHAHPDHIGLAGVLQELTGAPLYLLDVEEHLARRIWVEDYRFRVQVIVDMLTVHGVPKPWVEEAARGVQALRELVAPFGPSVPVRDGELLEVDGFSARVLWTPGHSDGHMVLLDAQGRLFCGDHVLPEVSPNVSLYPGARPNPLADYLDSLRRVRDLPVRLALPGHGEPLTSWAGRVDELLEHHRTRLEAAYALVPPEGTTAFQLAQHLFFADAGDGAQPPEVPLPLAVGEAAAHLEWLHQEGRLFREQGPPVVYRRAEGRP